MSDDKIHVLLVDDDEEELILTRGLLRDAAGSSIVLDWTGSGEAALESIRHQQHDVYLIDQYLGPNNGVDLITEAVGLGSRAPLILLTGHGNRELDLRAMQSGASDFLDKKNLSGPLLDRSIRYALERARMMERERESNQTLQSLIDASPLAICVLDLDGCISLWNDSAEKIFGWVSAEVIGQRLPIISDDREQEFRELFNRAIAGERLSGVSLKRTRKDGVDIDVNLWTSPLYNAQGRIVGLLGMYSDVTARVRAENALRASEVYYRELLENCSDIISVINPSATFQFVSPSVMPVLGMDSDSLIGVNAFELIHPDDQNLARELLGKALASAGTNVPFELRLRHADGSYRILEGMGRYLPQDAQVAGVVINCHDVTSRRHRERFETIAQLLSQPPVEGESLSAWLRRAHLQLAELMDADNFYVALYDSARELYWFPYVSDEHESFSVYTREEFRGTLTDYVRRTGKPLCVDQSEVDALVARGEVDDVGVPSAIWMGVPLTTARGVIGVAAMQNYQDASVYSHGESHLFAMLAERIALAIERQQAEEAQLRLATAIGQSADLVVITDSNGDIEYVNPAFERTTGFEAGKVLGKNPRFLKSGQHQHSFYQEMWQQISSGSVWSGNFVNRRRNGTLFTEVATITPVRDSSGRTVNYVKVSRDVTQQLLMESQLRQSQKLEAIGSLAAGIAHEINTPMQFVGNNAHFLSHSFSTLLGLLRDSLEAIEAAVNKGTPDPTLLDVLKKRDQADVEYLMKEIPEAIAQSLDGVSRVTGIVQAMREFSHPGTDSRSSLDVNRALSGALAVARSELKNVAEVVTEFDSGIPPIQCYPNEINQVFLNLLVNAAHAVADAKEQGRVRGTIRIRTRHSDGMVEVAVADNGMGIPAEIREQVFDPFFTTKPIGRGTGQGLAIARNTIVQKHGGSIHFETDEGRGTTFIVRLPVAPAEKETVP